MAKKWQVIGLRGLPGETGPQGPPGADGKTAYQYAQDGGYTGTEEDFAKKLASEDSGQNQNGLTTELKTALVNYYTHVMPEFDDENGLAYINAILTALGAETRGESGEEDTHAHSYTSEVTTAATCTTAGVRTYTCSCGESYTESIPATGHQYADGVCSVCGAADPDYNPDVTLSSISATYTGGEVAVGTAVTALTGVVVTAHYSDGSTATVTGYTLSGAIAEGSNTITVTYQGKTATFVVTGVAESGGDDTAGTDWEDGVAYTDFNWKENVYEAGAYLGTHEGYATTDYLPCKGASTISWASGIQGGYGYNAFHTAEKKFISKFAVSQNTNWEVTVPENAAYFRSTKLMTASDPVITPHA